MLKECGISVCWPDHMKKEWLRFLEEKDNKDKLTTLLQELQLLVRAVVRLGQSCNASIAFGHRWSPRGPSELVEEPGPEVICVDKDWDGNDHVDFRFVVTYDRAKQGWQQTLYRQQRP